MTELLLRALQTACVQLLLYMFLPAWALAVRRWENMGEWLFASTIAGISSAAVWGRMINGRGVGVGAALGIWMAVWMVAGIAGRWKKHEFSWPRPDGWLLGILLLAWVVRTIHPLQTWALGQSDAYSHLGFLCNVLEQGRIANTDYPPAYAWVMALPVRMWSEPPYWMARFGGAFFGLGLVLGTYTLMSRLQGRVAGWSAAALVAGCPLFWLLQKTGVGSFPNQMGLMLIPAVLWGYATGRYGWMALALAALAVSVPMMLLHALILLFLLLLLRWRRHGGSWIIPAVMVFAFLLAMEMVTQISPRRGMVIASMLTGHYELASQSGATWGGVFQALASDFISVKRWGYGSFALNSLALIMTACFAAGLAEGWKNRSTVGLVLGAWGLLASINVHGGLFQFTNYQREGWSLLIATACMGGLLVDILWRRPVLRRWLGAGVMLASAAGLVFPPRHTILGGAAESDMVRYLLALDPSVTVLARNMKGFAGGQGDVVRTLHPQSISEISERARIRGPVYFLRDRPGPVSQASFVARILQPALAAEYESAAKVAETDNQRLETQLSAFPVQKISVTPHLEVWIVSSGGNR